MTDLTVHSPHPPAALGMTNPAWDRPLAVTLIAHGIDLAHLCAHCNRPLLDHDGPLIIGQQVGEHPAPLYGDETCADASALLPGDVWDGGWIRDEPVGQVAA